MRQCEGDGGRAQTAVARCLPPVGVHRCRRRRGRPRGVRRRTARDRVLVGLRGRAGRDVRGERALPPVPVEERRPEGMGAAPRPLDDLRLHRRDVHPVCAASASRGRPSGSCSSRLGGGRLGLLLELVWIDSPRWLTAIAYLAVGWVGILAAPQMFSGIGVPGAVLVIVGGGLYTLGAVIYATKWPNPFPGLRLPRDLSSARRRGGRDAVRRRLAGGDVGVAHRVELTDVEWRERLSPEQYAVLRQQATERAFTGAYWDTKEPGVYRCAGCGAELFRSDAKFDSGSGWPSFVEPAELAAVETRLDRSHGMVRRRSSARPVEGTSATSSTTGRRPTGKRFCINSCASSSHPSDDGLLPADTASARSGSAPATSTGCAVLRDHDRPRAARRRPTAHDAGRRRVAAPRARVRAGAPPRPPGRPACSTSRSSCRRVPTSRGRSVGSQVGLAR